MKDAPNFITHLFGFEKLNKYEIEYLHDANIRSSSYMGVIVVLLEIWMLIRQTYSKIIPKLQAGEDLFERRLVLEEEGADVRFGAEHGAPLELGGLAEDTHLGRPDDGVGGDDEVVACFTCKRHGGMRL